MSNILCLNKGTKVTLEDGTLKNIENIEKEEKILSYNILSKLTEIVTVNKCAKSYHSVINRLTFSNGLTLESTTDHPIFTKSFGWCAVDFEQTLQNYNVQVGQLEVGQECLTLVGNLLSFVKIVSIEALFGNFEMFDISGGQYHCFFGNGILVHDENLTELQEVDGHFLEYSSQL